MLHCNILLHQHKQIVNIHKINMLQDKIAIKKISCNETLQATRVLFFYVMGSIFLSNQNNDINHRRHTLCFMI